MNLEILNDLCILINNDDLTKKIKLIDKLITLKKYKDAYFKLAVILEYINVLFINKILKINISNSDIMNICQIYLKNDKKLANKMISINGEYNLISENISFLNIDDVEILAANIYDIYKYMITNYGYFL